MSEQKSDFFTATGSHRAWVGERVLGEKIPASVPARSTPPLREAARSWINRPQQPPNARHAAITKNLAHFSNYKNWADKVKSDWKKDKPE
ncbi:MAG: hypothetical protein H7Y02_06895 [Candidatus Obscuribacterales bacterium]|nr:hypothetical protein [Steroidobacteraceae bacterium]